MNRSATNFCWLFPGSSLVSPRFAPEKSFERLRITTKRTVRHILITLTVNKTAGPDRISLLILKKYAPDLLTVLFKLFSLYMTTGIVPKTWKTARFLANYRPIILVSYHIKSH